MLRHAVIRSPARSIPDVQSQAGRGRAGAFALHDLQVGRAGDTPAGSGSTNPLDRIDALLRCTNDPRLVQWICQRAGGFFIRNPKTTNPHPSYLIPATNEIVQEFADLLAVVAAAAADNQITQKESQQIRARWEELKSVTETFVACCEEGNFRAAEREAARRRAVERRQGRFGTAGGGRVADERGCAPGSGVAAAVGLHLPARARFASGGGHRGRRLRLRRDGGRGCGGGAGRADGQDGRPRRARQSPGRVDLRRARRHGHRQQGGHRRHRARVLPAHRAALRGQQCRGGSKRAKTISPIAPGARR